MKDILIILSRYREIADKFFVLIKWLIFPFKTIEKYLPKQGEILDLGCAEGVLSIFLALKNKKRKVYGIDINKRKIELAKKAAFGLTNIKFFLGNALLWNKKVNAIVISDVFHHFSKKEQKKFLFLSKKILKKNGFLIIKEINKDDLIRSRLSRYWDYILYPHDKINYWSIKELTSELKKLNFKVKFFRGSPFFPGSTIVYICTKK